MAEPDEAPGEGPKEAPGEGPDEPDDPVDPNDVPLAAVGRPVAGPRLEDLRDAATVPDWLDAYVAAVIDTQANLVVSVAATEDLAIGYRVKHALRIKTGYGPLARVLERYCESLDVEPRVVTPADTAYDRFHVVVRSRADIATLLAAVRPHCLVRQEAIATFVDDILPALDRGDHTDRESFVELMGTIDRFRRLAGRANRARYDQAYFVAEWDIKRKDEPDPE